VHIFFEHNGESVFRVGCPSCHLTNIVIEEKRKDLSLKVSLKIAFKIFFVFVCIEDMMCN